MCETHRANKHQERCRASNRLRNQLGNYASRESEQGAGLHRFRRIGQEQQNDLYRTSVVVDCVTVALARNVEATYRVAPAVREDAGVLAGDVTAVATVDFSHQGAEDHIQSGLAF